MKTEISIAIVTKNRKKELENCLNSISEQTLIPNVIIIDNDINLSAKVVVNKKKYQKINIDYHHSKGSVPKCRNLAIKIAKTRYLGFADDDCVLNKKWTENGLRTIKKYKKTYVLGKTLLFNPEDLFALAQFLRDDYWKDYNSQIFDTKNVILDRFAINKHKLSFDEKCQKEAYDSADFDFDFLLKKTGLDGKFCKSMVLHHKETIDFKRFKRRAFYRGYLAKYLDKKWKLDDKLVNLKNKSFIFWILKTVKDFTSDLKKYNKNQKSSLCKKILATFVIKLFERYYVMGYVANREIK